MATDHAYCPIPVLTGPGIYGTFGVGQAIQTTEVSVRWMTLGCIIPAFPLDPTVFPVLDRNMAGHKSRSCCFTYHCHYRNCISLTTAIIGIVFHLPLSLSLSCFTYHCLYRNCVSLITVVIGLVDLTIPKQYNHSYHCCSRSQVVTFLMASLVVFIMVILL